MAGYAGGFLNRYGAKGWDSGPLAYCLGCNASDPGQLGFVPRFLDRSGECCFWRQAFFHGKP